MRLWRLALLLQPFDVGVGRWPARAVYPIYSYVQFGWAQLRYYHV